MALLHETGVIGAPVPVYFETFAPARASARPTVLMIHGDNDLLQLVNPHVKVMTSRRGISDTILYDEARVIEKYDGLRPDQVRDFKALRGDVTDNIPGVPGIGDKTAMALIQEYGALESILAAVPSMKEGKVGRWLIDEGAQVHFGDELLEIETDKIVVELEAPARDDVERRRVAPFLLGGGLDVRDERRHLLERHVAAVEAVAGDRQPASGSASTQRISLARERLPSDSRPG